MLELWPVEDSRFRHLVLPEPAVMQSVSCVAERCVCSASSRGGRVVGNWLRTFRSRWRLMFRQSSRYRPRRCEARCRPARTGVCRLVGIAGGAGCARCQRIAADSSRSYDQFFISVNLVLCAEISISRLAFTTAQLCPEAVFGFWKPSAHLCRLIGVGAVDQFVKMALCHKSMKCQRSQIFST